MTGRGDRRRERERDRDRDREKRLRELEMEPQTLSRPTDAARWREEETFIPSVSCATPKEGKRQKGNLLGSSKIKKHGPFKLSQTHSHKHEKNTEM